MSTPLNSKYSLTDGYAAHAVVLRMVKNFSDEAVRVVGANLVAIVHYGSTVTSPLKRTTDIDLLVIVRELPHGRNQLSGLFDEIEFKLLHSYGEALSANGFNLVWSPVVKTLVRAKKFWLPYLDMTEKSSILYDPDHEAAAILERTRVWICKSGARKIQRGLSCYWDLCPNFKQGQPGIVPKIEW